MLQTLLPVTLLVSEPEPSQGEEEGSGHVPTLELSQLGVDD